jgi:glycosyltransferase involved in cell wall biosynthesis
MTDPNGRPRIAVLVPCYNEEASIDKVVRDFRGALPGAEIHVCDNASTDTTIAVAAAAGATIHR